VGALLYNCLWSVGFQLKLFVPGEGSQIGRVLREIKWEKYIEVKFSRLLVRIEQAI